MKSGIRGQRKIITARTGWKEVFWFFICQLPHTAPWEWDPQAEIQLEVPNSSVSVSICSSNACKGRVFHQILLHTAFCLYFRPQKERWAQRIQLKKVAIFPAADMKGNRDKCIAHELGAHQSMVIPFSLSGSTGLPVEERLQTDYSLQECWRLICTPP